MPLMRRLAALLILTACGHPPAPVAPQPTTGSIAGTVHEAASREPLSFVTVFAGAAGEVLATAVTDGDGAFTLGDLQPGRYQVTARFGERSVTVDDVAVTAGAAVPLTLALALVPAQEAPAGTAAGGAPVAAGNAPPIDHDGVGGIRGLIRDRVSNEVLPGAVVTATTPGVRDAIMSMADGNGHYRMPALRPGLYTLSAYYTVIDRGNIEVRRTNVRVVAGEMTVVDLDLDAQKAY